MRFRGDRKGEESNGKEREGKEREGEGGKGRKEKVTNKVDEIHEKEKCVRACVCVCVRVCVRVRVRVRVSVCARAFFTQGIRQAFVSQLDTVGGVRARRHRRRCGLPSA